MLPDLASLEYFHFLRPLWLLLLLPWLLLIRLGRNQRNQKDMFGGIIAPELLEHLRLDSKDSRWINPTTFGGAFIVLCLVVAIGPSWRQQPSPLSQDKSAMVIVLDASSSMEQGDVQPSRLERAKQKASDLLSLRPDKKSALIVYAGTAHTVLTLTADQDILNQYLAAIKPSMMPRSGKFAEQALPLVDEILRDTTAAATVVLITDGLGSNTGAEFTDYFEQHSHQLLVLGIGGDSDEDGVVPLERGRLQTLASDSGGHYVDFSIDDSDVRALERRIESHYVIIDDDALPWLDSGYPLIFICMALWLMWFRKGWTITWAWLVLPMALAITPEQALAQEKDKEQEVSATAQGSFSMGQWFTELWLTPDQQGRLLLQRGDYHGAASHFEDPLWKGIAYYYNEDFMQAAEYFSRSGSDDALFNEANARAHARDFLRAVKRYDQLLTRAQNYPGAAENRATVQALIDEINRMSESQHGEEGSSEEKQMGGDDAIPAEGAEKLNFDQVEIKQYTAEEILQSEATRDMWLRGVQQDPSNFLATKFNMQLQRREPRQ